MLKLDVSDLPASIVQTYRWWDYGDAAIDVDRRVYLTEMRDSAFVLCPRGLAPGTHRVYEAMQLGRAPVILVGRLGRTGGSSVGGLLGTESPKIG